MTTTSVQDPVEKFADWDSCVNQFEGDVEMAKVMFKLLVTELEDSTTELKTIIENKDSNRLFALSHKLRGGCVYCGTMPLAAHCLSIEQVGLQDPKCTFEKLSTLAQALLELIDKTLQETLSIIDRYVVQG